MAEDGDWVRESLAGFLSSPDWVIPLADFMENKCSVFDDEDENKLTYTEIHRQYKQLVEQLLESFTQEVGISEAQFLEACSSFSSSKSLQAVFQPVLATDDFQMFRSLMVQKNMELQLQALHVIKERNGGLPECLTDGVDVMSELEQQEMKILQEVLKRSKEEYDLQLAQRSQDPQDPEDREDQASTSSSVCEPQSPVSNGLSCSHTHTHTHSPAEETVTAPRQSKALPVVRAPVKGSASVKNTTTERQRHEERVHDTHAEPTAVSDEVALQQRSAYLKQQRDKLQALKRDQTVKGPADTPPAAPEPTHHTQEISVEEKKKLQKRKHLAEKLKEEVIKK